MFANLPRISGDTIEEYAVLEVMFAALSNRAEQIAIPGCRPGTGFFVVGDRRPKACLPTTTKPNPSSGPRKRSVNATLDESQAAAGNGIFVALVRPHD
jgi:hypothetical protein